MNKEKLYGWSTQVVGSYYTKYKIQPAWFAQLNYWGYCPANVLKYIMRYTDKNGIEDLQKAFDYTVKHIEYITYMRYNEINPGVLSGVRAAGNFITIQQFITANQINDEEMKEILRRLADNTSIHSMAKVGMGIITLMRKIDTDVSDKCLEYMSNHDYDTGKKNLYSDVPQGEI